MIQPNKDFAPLPGLTDSQSNDFWSMIETIFLPSDDFHWIEKKNSDLPAVENYHDNITDFLEEENPIHDPDNNCPHGSQDNSVWDKWKAEEPGGEEEND